MKLKVKQGSVKYDDTVYTEGQTFEISESQAKALLREGVVEEVQENAPEEKPKKAKKEKAKKEPVKKAPVEEAEAVKAEPSIEWTKKELDDYAKAHGIEEPEKLGSKQEVLDALASGAESPAKPKDEEGGETE